MPNDNRKLSDFFTNIHVVQSSTRKRKNTRIEIEDNDEYVPPKKVHDSAPSQQRDLFGNRLPNSALKKTYSTEERQEKRAKKTVREWEDVHTTGTLLSQFKRPLVQAKVKTKINTEIAKIEIVPPSIIARADGKIPGEAAYYDHFTMQKATGLATQSIMTKDLIKKDRLGQYVGNHASNQLQSTVMTKSGHSIPQSLVLDHEDTELFDELNESDSDSESGDEAVAIVAKNLKGMLYIPGLPRKLKSDVNYLQSARHLETQYIIRQAKLRGMPIFAVCGGAWELWTSFPLNYAENNFNPKTMGGLIPARDHACQQGMPSVNPNNATVVRNKQVHLIKLVGDHTVLRGAMGYTAADEEKKLLGVNSVHWQAPDPRAQPRFLEVTAIAKEDPEFQSNSRQGTGRLKPEENTIEAFETKSGAPTIGVMWHPEAYAMDDSENALPQRAMLMLMAKQAGASYTARRKMALDLQEKFNTLGYAHSLRATSLFKRDKSGNAISTKAEEEGKQYVKAATRNR